MGNVTAKTSGEIASFMTPAETNIKSLKVYFSPKQLGEGDPSPENVREIVGWDSVEVNGCGKNIAHIVGYSATNSDSNNTRKISNNYGTTLNTTEFSLPDTKLIITQTQYPNTTNLAVYHNGYCAVLVDNLIWGQKYNVSFKVEDIVSNPLNTSIANLALLVPSGGRYAVDKIQDNRLFFDNVEWQPYPNANINRRNFEIRISGMSFTLSEFMVTPVDEDDFEYEPYQGNINTIDWSSEIGTVYGGYVDLISGELVEEYNFVNIDYSNPWNTTTNYLYRNDNLPPSIGGRNMYVKTLCSHRINPYDVTAAVAVGTQGILSVGRKFCEMAGIEMTSDVFNQYLEEQNNNGTPLEICYLLKTPITHQLTPTQLSSFIGQNNFWSNADYVEIEYELKETEDIQKCRKKIILNQPHIESVKDDLVNFTTDMKVPLKECKVYFEPVQEGEGDPSPDNVRNITGWDETNIYLSNEITLFNNFGATSGRASGINNNKRVTTNSYGTTINRIDTDGIKTELVVTQSIADSTKERYQNGYISLFPNTDKLIIGNSYYFDADIEIISNPLNKLPEMMLTDDANNRWTITINDGKLHEAFTWKERPTVYQYPFIEFYCNGCSFKLKNMVIVPSREVKTINWTDQTGTVYGGYVDLISGELIANMAMVEFDGSSDENWQVETLSSGLTNYYMYATSLVPKARGKQRTDGYICSNICIPRGENETYISGMFYFSNSGALNVYLGGKSNTSTVAEFKSWLTEHKLQVAYWLAEPIRYQLTPQQLLTFKGTNNIWSNSNGQTEVKFWTY